MTADSKMIETRRALNTTFSHTRELFELPEGVIYLDGNSLGPMPRAALQAAQRVMADEWSQQLIRAWNSCGWFTQPGRIGDRIGRLIGAAAGTVVMGDTLSIKVYQALAAALEMRPERKIILSDRGNFPSDLYMAQGLVGSLGKGHVLKVVAPEDVAQHVNADVAVLMLTEVDYRSGRKHDMAALTKLAHRHGALALWDLAHSAGAFPVDVEAANVDFAVGCTYKYLNGGPGAPAFIYVSPRHAEQTRPALSGWMGHKQPFAFEPDYRAATGIERMRVGTPPVIALAVLEAALDIWDKVDLAALRSASLELGDQFIEKVMAGCPTLKLATPRKHAMRGSQVSFSHPQAYAIMQALIERGVIGDFRAPDILRFGLTPLYLDKEDVKRAAEILSDIMQKELWNQARFKAKSLVT